MIKYCFTEVVDDPQQGQFFKDRESGEIYLLAKIGGHRDKYSLVSLTTGNRWADPAAPPIRAFGDKRDEFVQVKVHVEQD